MLSRQSYYAYGGVRSTNGALPTDIGYTGQRLDGTGLMYYNARYFSPTLGRFVSADTVVPGAGNPQAFNRYAYTKNNPLRYTDPSGHCEVICWTIVGIVAIALIVSSPDVDPWLNGQVPNSGPATAEQLRSYIEPAAATNNMDALPLGAGIAVQSPGQIGDQFGGSSLGPAQIRDTESKYFVGGPNNYQPYDPEWAAGTLANKMMNAVNNCDGCSREDQYVAMAIGQNQPVEATANQNGHVDWQDYLANQSQLAPGAYYTVIASWHSSRRGR